MKTVLQEFSTLGVGVLNRFALNLVRFPELVVVGVLGKGLFGSGGLRGWLRPSA
jgi:hypothetical protein